MSRCQSLQYAFTVILSAAASVTVAGCSMPKASDFKPSKLFSLSDEEEPEVGIPVRMVGTWTDTVLSQPGKKGQRGFGGRLMFYERSEEKPILVEGQLVVYAFDETGRDVTDNKPTRRYVFPPDQIARHMSKSELGASYSFWLPWDDVGGPQTEVSLICRFEPKGGSVVTSEQTKHMLPGTITPGATVARREPPKLPEGVPSRPAQPTLESLQASRIVDRNTRLASYENPVLNEANLIVRTGATAALPSIPEKMTTTSIALPPNYRLPAGPAVAPTAIIGEHNPHSTRQVLPIQSQQPAAAQPQPVVTPTPAVQPQPVPGSRFGAFPAQPSIMPTVATPTVYSPASGGFGFAASSQQQVASPPIAPQVARAHAPRTVTWNTVQTAPSAMLQQQQAYAPPTQGQTIQGQMIMQPASQPLPPPTEITTTVSYPQQAGAVP
jgi:hypothetical protein